MLPNIYFIARQAGTAAAFTPLIKELSKEFNCIKLAYDKAFELWKNQDISSSLIQCFEDIDFTVSPDIIITGTSLEVNDNNKIWKYAKMYGIPSVGFLDSWVNYWQRFSSDDDLPLWDCTPDKIAVIDKFMYKKCLEWGANSRLLKITGSPTFESLKDEYDSYDNYKPICSNKLLLVMDPLVDYYDEETIEKLGYTEFDFLNDCLSFLKASQFQKTIELRLHPREKANKYDEIIKLFGELKIEISDFKKSKIKSLHEAEVVFGMNSILLYEAAILGKKVYSYQIGANNISDIINNQSSINIVKSKDNLSSILASPHNISTSLSYKSTLLHLIKNKVNERKMLSNHNR